MADSCAHALPMYPLASGTAALTLRPSRRASSYQLDDDDTYAKLNGGDGSEDAFITVSTGEGTLVQVHT